MHSWHATGYSRCASFQFALRAMEQHNQNNLWHCQLCTHLLTPKGCRKGDKCSFAHSLGALRPAPTRWSLAARHYWEQGDPTPSAEVHDLIMKYIEYQKLPMWLFRAQMHPAFHGDQEPTPKEPACKKNRPTPKEPTPKARPTPSSAPTATPFLPPTATSSPTPPLVPKQPAWPPTLAQRRAKGLRPNTELSKARPNTEFSKAKGLGPNTEFSK